MSIEYISYSNDSSNGESLEENKWNDSLLEDFVENVNAGDIVPIIGSGAYKVQGYNSVQEYLVKKLFENLYQKYKLSSISLTDENLKSLCEGYHGMTKVAKILKGY